MSEQKTGEGWKPTGDLDYGTFRFAARDHSWLEFEERRLKEMQAASGTPAFRLIMDAIEDMYLRYKDEMLFARGHEHLVSSLHAAQVLRGVIDAIDRDVHALSERDRRAKESARSYATGKKVDALREAGRDRYMGVEPEHPLNKPQP